MSALALGLDVGTQGTKGLLLDVETGCVVARAQAAYDLLPGLPDGAAEQHPSTWIEAVTAVVRALLSTDGVRAEALGSIGVSGQQHGCVVLDAQDNVVRAAKLWCDTSTAREADELAQRYGHPVPTGFTASKLLWIARHEPENFARIESVLLPHDYVNFRLTGTKTTEAGDASGTGFFDPLERRFVVAEIDAIAPGLAAKLPPLIAPGAPAGRTGTEFTRALGLPDGLPVSSGGGDNMMSAIGAGATRPGTVVLSLGTSGTIFAYAERPILDPEGLIAPFCDSTGGWLPLLCVMNVTGVFEVVRAAFAGDAAATHEEWTKRAARVPRGADGLRFLPYLAGERVPDLPAARGALLGLRTDNFHPAAVYRAALEGTSLNLAWGCARLRALGIEADELRVVGGAARNGLLTSILAACFDTPLVRLEEQESAALGAAIQGLWTARRLAQDNVTADELARSIVRVAPDTIEPDRDDVTFYREQLERFREDVASVYGAGVRRDGVRSSPSSVLRAASSRAPVAADDSSPAPGSSEGARGPRPASAGPDSDADDFAEL